MACSIISTYGEVRRRTAHLHTVPREHLHATRLGLITDLRHQARLTNAGLTGHQREPAVSNERVPR